MAKSFDLASITGNILSDVSKETENTLLIHQIAYEDIIPNENNFYQTEDLEGLAEDIRANGLRQNLETTPEKDGKYILLAGHRRYLAIGIIRKEHPEMFQYVPVNFNYNVKDEDDELIAIITANSTIRNMSDAEKLKQFRLLNAALQRKIDSGEQIKGRRPYLASLLQTSETQIQRYMQIEKSLIPELLEKVENDQIGIRTASDIYAKMSPEKQLEVLHRIDAAETEKVSPDETLHVINVPKAQEKESTTAGDSPVPTEPDEPIKDDNPEDDSDQSLNSPASAKKGGKVRLNWDEIAPLKKTVEQIQTSMLPNKYLEISGAKKVSVDKQIEKAQQILENIRQKLGID